MSHLRHLYKWIPSLYLMEGLPFALITLVTPIIYKSFKMNNAQVAFYTSLFTLPWLCKPAIAPLLETLASRRALVIWTQFLLVGGLLLVVMSFQSQHFFLISGILFFILATIGAIYDMNADGLYIINLNTQEQAHFIGVRSLFYQIGRLLCQGGLIYAAGCLMHYFTSKVAWQIILSLLAATILILASYHLFILPATKKPFAAEINKPANSFQQVFSEFLAIPYFFPVVLFVFSYNIVEAQLAKIVPLFLLDNINHGGLGLTIKQVGILYGGVGTTSMLLGLFIAGFLLAKFSLKRCLVPITLLVSLTNIGYFILSLIKFPSTSLIGIVLILAQFGYGLCNGAYMLYLLNAFTKGQFPMSLYAIGTALMGLSVLAGGAISGFMQDLLGYTGFFSWILFANFCIILISVYNAKKVL